MYRRRFCDNFHSDDQNSVLYNDILLNNVNINAGSVDSVSGELQPLSSHLASPVLYSVSQTLGLSQYPPSTGFDHSLSLTNTSTRDNTNPVSSLCDIITNVSSVSETVNIAPH